MGRRVLAVGVLLVGLLFGAYLAPEVASTFAQDATPCAPGDGTAGSLPDPAPVVSSQRLLGQAEFADLPDNAAQVSTVQLTLAPGDGTQRFASDGPVLIVVQEGTVTLDADQALVGPPPEPTLGVLEIESPTPGAATGLEVSEDTQIELGAGTNLQLRNEGDVRVRLLLISVVPGGTTAAPAGG